MVVITAPSDERLLIKSSESLEGKLRVRAKVWAEDEILGVSARLEGRDLPMRRVANSQVWEAMVDASVIGGGAQTLVVQAEVARGKTATDEIRVVIGNHAQQKRAERDQDNALEAWPEHGLLGTQLGPNKNGKKW